MLVVVALLAVTACSDDGGDASNGDESDATIELVALSTRAEYATGGDVLVHVKGVTPDEWESGDLAVGLGDDPDTAVISVDRAGRVVALVAGLEPGENEVTASFGGATAELTVTDNPVTGPLFSGPHRPLPVCTTETYDLGPATDEDCSAPVTNRWKYVTTEGEIEPLEGPAERPADLMTIEEGEHAGKPFIIREESGVINRAIYWIDVLDPDPKPVDPTLDGRARNEAWDRTAWNGRLVYEFGGGCGTTYTQGFQLLNDPSTELLARGYARATATFNTFQVMCDDVLSAETALMVKEHFTETYDVPEHTIGSGGSGGAIQQLLIAQNYPGILDAVGASLPFPDAFSIAPGVTDCVLLNAYYRTPDGSGLSAEQRAAINGHLTAKTCDFWEQTFAKNLQPDAGCSLDVLSSAGAFIEGLPQNSVDFPKLPEELRYDAETNPDGLRCTLQDGMVNVLGTDPETGFGNRPLDNAAVQYGLQALNEGAIDVEQFLTLNELVGGADIDGQLVPERMTAREEQVRAVFETGRVLDGSGDLRRIPLITVNVWTDEEGDIHDRFRAFSIRDRLALEDGTDPPNAMLWTRGLAGQSLISALTGTVDVGTEVVITLDEWLTALREEDEGSLDERLERSRPEAAVDNCLDADGNRVSGLDIYDGPGPCTDPYPISGDSRTAAGAPRRNDVGSCQRQSIDEARASGIYEVDLTDAQVDRLESIFPDGVCDYSKPGIGQVPSAGPWQTF